jgi:hypothetical protein
MEVDYDLTTTLMAAASATMHIAKADGNAEIFIQNIRRQYIVT